MLFELFALGACLFVVACGFAFVTGRFVCLLLLLINGCILLFVIGNLFNSVVL